MRDPLDVAQPHRQQRLRALPGLDLTLLIDTQYETVIGRVRVAAPPTSRTFSMKNGSVESLKAFERCGCTPKSER